MSDTKLSALPNASNVAPTDTVLVLYNAVSNNQIANGSPSTRTISISNLSSSLYINNFTPPSSQSPGNQGNISFDENFFYVCVSNNVWLRSPLSTW